jgi:hypothetical protein
MEVAMGVVRAVLVREVVRGVGVVASGGQG